MDKNIIDAWVASRQRVQTVKGAHFTGVVIASYENTCLNHFGVVVMADDPDFYGSVHVYPATQLEVV